MTKKIFAMFLAVLMVVSMLPTTVFAASCPAADKHTTGNCEYTVVKVTDPTCGTAGHTSYKCNKCGVVFAEVTAPATGEHTWIAGESKAPTCVNDGWEAGMECEGCGLEIPGKTIPAVGKEGTEACEYVLIELVDCTVGGKNKYQCAFCGDITYGEYQKPKKHTMAYAYVTVISADTAVVPCYFCEYYELVSIENAHNCTEYMFEVDAVAADCTTNGMEAHYECRVCQQKYLWDVIGEDENKNEIYGFAALDEEGVEDLVIPAQHDFGRDATCVDTMLYCQRCEKEVPAGVDHYFYNEDGNLNIKEYKGETCTKSGYMVLQCTVCNKEKDVVILDAAGHREVTVTVPATCGSFGYTFTYCTRPNCDASELDIAHYEDGVAVSVTDEYGIEYSVKAPAMQQVKKLSDVLAMEEGFLLGLDQDKLGKNLYFAGAMNGYYLATTDDFEKATTVYLEKVENYRSRYLMYFFNKDGDKLYIDIVWRDGNNGGRANVKIVEEPVNYYTWNATIGSFTTTINGVEFYLGTYGTYNTISASNNAKFPATSASQFLAGPFAIGDEAGVSLINVEFDYEGGYNAEEHAYVAELGSLKMPTCDEAGSLDYVCKYCFDTVTETLPAGCLSVAGLNNMANLTLATAEELKAAKISGPVSADATCTKAGFTWVKCTDCEELYKIPGAPALGHETTVEVEILPNHIDRVGYKGMKCVDCDYVLKEEVYTWEYATTVFEDYDAASAAHGDCDLTFKNLSKAGNCDTLGIEIWTCDGCGKNVRIKQWLKLVDKKGNAILDENGDEQWFVTGEHAGHKIYHEDPTCTEAGWHTTYECVRCGDIIGNKELGETEELKALGHDWFDNSEVLEYVAAPCGQPNYNNLKYTCSVCGVHTNDGTTLILNSKIHNGDKDIVDGDLYNCKMTTLELYRCHCGELHMRSLGGYNHKWVALEMTKENSKAPTCYNVGYYTAKCEYCDAETWVEIPTVEHKNAAGEKFTDSCLDEVTDRHCVVCCEHFEHDKLGNKHDCTKTDKDENDEEYFICSTVYHEHDYCTDCTEDCADDCTVHCNGCDKHCNGFYAGCLMFLDGGCQVDSFCHFLVQDDWKRPSTCIEDAHTLEICVDCKEEKLTPAAVNDYIHSAGSRANEDTVWFYGHKPVSSPVKYAAYTYKNLYWQDVKVIDGEFVYDYNYIWNAEFIEYVAPTYASEGYAKMYCAVCDDVVEQVLPKLSGVGFELEINNANGSDEYTYGSLIEVIVYANGNGDLVNTFAFDLSFFEMMLVCEDVQCKHEDEECYAAYSDIVFVGSERAEVSDFNITVSEPKKSPYAVSVNATAVRNESGKQQNIAITGKTELMKLYFRVSAEKATEVDFRFENSTVYWVYNKQLVVAYGANFIDETIETRTFLDFNDDTVANLKDLILAETMLTFEHPEGKTYDVTLDINKDGEVTPEELTIAYNYHVGNYELEELLVIGMTEAEIALMGLTKATICNNSVCQKEIDADATYCPYCGNHQ